MPTTIIKTIKPGGGGDYTSLAAWEADRRGNIITRDTIEVAECYSGNLGTLSLADANWTVDSTHYVIVRPATDHEHRGFFDTGRAYVSVSSGNGILVTVKYTRLSGLSIESTSSSTGDAAINFSPLFGKGIMDSCICRNPTGYAIRAFSDLRSGGETNEIRNCVFLHDSSGDQDCVDTGDPFGDNPGIVANFYNCTIINFRDSRHNINVRASSPVSDNVKLQNCYLYQQTGGVGINYGGNGVILKGSTDATNNTEATSVALRNIALSTANFTNVSYSTFDAHLAEDSALIDKGTNLSAQGVTTDFEGDTRSGSFDIGADEVPDTGGISLGLWGV